MSTPTGTVPITSATLGRLFEFTYDVTKRNLEGFDHEGSLKQPGPGVNCLNWVVGHIVATRNSMLKLLGEEAIWSEDETRIYGRGSDPVPGRSAALPLDRILGDFDRTQEGIRRGLAALIPEALLSPLPEGDNPFGLTSVGEMLAAFNFHEAYHAGQLGILRRILGKEPGSR